MKAKIAQCATLKEYRETVLRLPQREVARLAGCQQGWITQVERGHLPRPWNRESLLRAYRLEKYEEEFVRMVTNAAKLRELSHPLEETHPLMAAVQGEVEPLIGKREPITGETLEGDKRRLSLSRQRDLDEEQIGADEVDRLNQQRGIA